MSDGNKPEHFRISAQLAEDLIAERLQTLPAEAVPLAEATGRILCEDVIAERDQPPFNRATMDGIAVSSSADVRSYTIAGVQAAGADAQTLANAEDCFEVMTGAAMPAGADTVIPVERISIQDGVAIIEEGYTAEPQQFVHQRGSDHREGDGLMRPGTRIGPPEMAALTAAGSATVKVSCLPAIAVVSTGDELVDVGEAMGDTQIRSSNDRAIEASLRQRGFTKVSRHTIADDREALHSTLSRLLDANDVLILSGGVSMGKFDYIPGVLNELGIEVVFHKITQRPGLPMWFGVHKTNGKPVFALPGNPVSTLVCLTRYVLPAIQQMSAAGDITAEYATLSTELKFEPALSWFVPVTLESGSTGLIATPKLTNTSGDFVALANTAGFIELDAAQNHFAEGYTARLFRW